MRRAVALVLLCAAWSAAIPADGVTLHMKDGRVLEGRDVRRDGDLYLLELEGGGVIPLPSALVATVGIATEPEPPPEVRTGLVEAEPQQLAGHPAKLRVAEPHQLAGAPVEAPTTGEQLAVFGKPATFQRDAVTPTLGPNYWVLDPSENLPNPAKWAKAPIDSSWAPTSGFDDSKDVLEGSRSTWQKAPIDSTWQPTDGFAKSKR